MIWIFQVTKKVENPTVVDLPAPPKKHSVVVEQNAAGGQPITRIENNIEATEVASATSNEEPKFVSQGCQTERSMMASNHSGTNTTETSNANNKEGENLASLGIVPRAILFGKNTQYDQKWPKLSQMTKIVTNDQIVKSAEKCQKKNQ